MILALNLLGVTPALLNPGHAPSEASALLSTSDPKAVIASSALLPLAKAALETKAEGKAIMTDILVDKIGEEKRKGIVILSFPIPLNLLL